MSNPNEGWEEVGADAAADRDYNILVFKKVGDQAIGKLLQIIKDIPGTYGPETHYVLQRPDGKIAVNPNADLKRRLTAVTVGDMIRITYVSDKDIGKPSLMKVFQVDKHKSTSATAAASAKYDF